MGAAAKGKGAEVKTLAPLALPRREMLEALSRIHSHLIVLAEGQDAILRAIGKRRRYG
jgi:hypothetical protein